MGFEIRAGAVEELRQDSVEWLFVDVGFSSTDKSCGVLKNKEKPQTMKFGNLVGSVIQEAQSPASSPLNLLLEAPLSVAFDKHGNPTRRSTDSEESEGREEYRDWWYNAGSSTLLATGHLLRRVYESGLQREVRLFEGFASFKSTRPKWDRIESFSKTDWPHIEDLLRLRCAALDVSRKFVTDQDNLKTPTVASLISAFKFADMDFGIPPVVKACRCGSEDMDRHL